MQMSGISTPTAPRDPQPEGGREVILMVEDNAEIREMGATLLEDAGFEVHQAADADEALSLVAEGLPFDLLFTDIVMPGAMDGVALAVEVLRLRPGTPVLLTTGWGDRADDRAGLELIGKPYRSPDLTRKIRAVLDEPGPPA